MPEESSHPSRPPGRCPGPVRIGSAVACAVVDRDLDPPPGSFTRGLPSRGGQALYPRHGEEKREATRKPGRAHPGRPRRRRYPGARHPGNTSSTARFARSSSRPGMAARSVNTAMVRAYWLVGPKVVEEEQEGNAGPATGTSRSTNRCTSGRIRSRLQPENLRYMRLFYLAYPHLLARQIHHAVRDKSGQEAGEPGKTGRLTWRVLGSRVLNPESVLDALPAATKVELPLARTSTRSKPFRTTWRRASWSDRSILCSSSAWPGAATRRGCCGSPARGRRSGPPNTSSSTYSSSSSPESPSCPAGRVGTGGGAITNLETFLLELGKGFAFVFASGGSRSTGTTSHPPCVLSCYHKVLYPR